MCKYFDIKNMFFNMFYETEVCLKPNLKNKIKTTPPKKVGQRCWGPF